MIFSIKFVRFELKENNYEALRSKIIEVSEDCIVHDCNTPTGFTIQLKSRDFNTKGRVEVKASYDNTNTVIIGIEKEFQTSWSLNKMEQLVKELQNFDQGIK